MFGLPLPQTFFFVTISPFEDPIRTAVFILPIMVLGINSLHILTKINPGITIILKPHQPWSLRIFSGRVYLTKEQKAEKYVSSYSNPFTSMLLGLLFFGAAQFLMIMLFLKPIYLF